MKLRAIVASTALALGVVAGAPVAAPAMNAVGVETPGVTAEAASIGWGPICRTQYYRVYSGPGVSIYKKIEYRWWTSSLQSTMCVLYDSRYTVSYR